MKIYKKFVAVAICLTAMSAYAAAEIIYQTSGLSEFKFFKDTGDQRWVSTTQSNYDLYTDFAQSGEAANTKDEKAEQQRKPLTAKAKRIVWKRANACCEHIDSESKARCTSKFALETDHIIAVALGGSNELDNLQLLCRAHNSRRSIKTFGSRL
jgi:hypothetical protein